MRREATSTAAGASPRFWGARPTRRQLTTSAASSCTLVESGLSICNRNRIMTGVRFLFRATLRRHDLAAEVYHLKEPQKLPLVMSPEEAKRLLAMSGNLKVHVMLALGYGCGLRAGEIVRLRAGDIDSAQMIIRIVQGKGRKSLPSRKRGIATSCCRPRCSRCCGNGGRRGRPATMPGWRRRSAGYSPGVDAALEQMRGKAVAQRMQADAL